MLAEARARAGCDDFGDPDFRPRLDAMIDAVEADTGLGPLGRLADPPAHRCACSPSRLLVEDLVRRRPEILDIELAGADHRDRAAPFGHDASRQPHRGRHAGCARCPTGRASNRVPRPGDGPGRDGVDPRFTRCQTRLRRADADGAAAPRDAPPVPDRDRGGDRARKTSTSRRTRSNGYARVPGWRDFYFALDQRAHYAYMKKVLQVLTFLRGPNRWVLKSPQHLEQIPALLATFPDATFAITHRDPVSVIQSAVDDARVRRPHAPGRDRTRGARRRTGSTASTGCCARACATATSCPPTAASTCCSTSSWPTTSAWSSASTHAPAST